MVIHFFAIEMLIQAIKFFFILYINMIGTPLRYMHFVNDTTIYRSWLRNCKTLVAFINLEI